jgi:hypothetical protein
VEPGLPALRVKIPCRDAREFRARLADHIAAKGLRVPSEQRRAIGTRLRVALELRNGDTLWGDAVVDGHVDLDARAGVSLRFLGAPAAAGEPVPDQDDPPGGAPLEPPPLPRLDPLGTSGEIIASVNRQVARMLGGIAALSALALVLAAAGYAVGLRLAAPRSRESVAAARVAQADRLLAEGRILGKDGALEKLLAARDASPDDDAVGARLERVADLLESLGSRAIGRGDLPVASVHLAAAELADPTRESIRAKRAFLAAKARADEAPPRTARTRKRR